jgi:adenosylhomocysteine nucleosidase
MILIATGLKRELNILKGVGVRVVAGGGDAARLERELEEAARDADAVLSMGLCGALADGLKPGDWVVAAHIFPSPLAGEGVGGAGGWGVRGGAASGALETPPSEPLRGPPSPQGGREIKGWPTDANWAASLAKALRAQSGPMLGSDTMIADAGAKAAAHAATGALAVDMESHIAAAVARRHGLPFAVARVVSDAADRSLPKAAQAGMAADGSMDIVAVLKALAADPRQLPALMRVGAEAGKAFRELRRGRDLLGPGLGRLDLVQHLLDMP